MKIPHKHRRTKGTRFEREAVAMLQEHGFAAERVPLSGSVGGRYSGDVSCPIAGIDRKLECKARGTGFKQIYAWISGHYGLVVKADRREALITVRLADFAELAARAELATPRDFPHLLTPGGIGE